MAVYVGVCLFIGALALYELFTKNKKIAIGTGSLMALMAGFRFYTGYDFVSYRDYYIQIDEFVDIFNGSTRLEPGYVFLNYIFQAFSFNYHTFVLFFALLSIFLLTFFLYKYTSYPSIFLLYYFARYFLVRDMGQIRASLAAIILLYAIPFIFRKKLFPFLAVVLIASLFHVSSWAFVIAYALHAVIKKLTVQNSVGLLGLATLMGLLVQSPSLFLWAIPEYYHPYVTATQYTNGDWVMNPVLWMQLLMFFGTLIFVRHSNSVESEKFDVLLKVYLLGSLALLGAGTLSTVGGRISTLFATTEIIVVPYFFMNVTRNKLLNLIGLLCFTIAIFVLIFIISGAYTSYIPYNTVF